MLEFKDWLQIVNVGALAMMVYCFIRGHIVSRTSLDAIIAAVVKQVLKELNNAPAKPKRKR